MRLLGVLCGICLAASQLAAAADPPSAVSSVLKLLKSGKVPPARMGSVVEMVCTRGNEHDLAYVFEQVADEKAYSLELRRQALGWLKGCGPHAEDGSCRAVRAGEAPEPGDQSGRRTPEEVDRADRGLEECQLGPGTRTTGPSRHHPARDPGCGVVGSGRC